MGWYALDSDAVSAGGLLDALVDSTRDGLAVVGPGRGVLGFNPRFRSIWSLPSEACDAPRAAYEHVLAQLRPASRRRLSDLNGERQDLRLHLEDGRIVEGHCAPVDGERQGVHIWVHRDVTERVRIR